MTSTTLPGTNPTEHGGATTASDFGDVRAEFQALLEGCGVYDLSWRAKIAVTGGDRVRWLNGMATNNVRDLAPGHGIYAFLLNAQGRIQADLYVFQRGKRQTRAARIGRVGVHVAVGIAHTELQRFDHRPVEAHKDIALQGVLDGVVAVPQIKILAEVEIGRVRVVGPRQDHRGRGV